MLVAGPSGCSGGTVTGTNPSVGEASGVAVAVEVAVGVSLGAGDGVAVFGLFSNEAALTVRVSKRTSTC